MARLREARGQPTTRVDDQIERFWYAPGFSGDVAFLLLRPGGETRQFLSYRYREYTLDLGGRPDPARVARERVAGGWLSTGADPVAMVEGSIQDLYASGFGHDSSDRTVYSIENVTTLTINGNRGDLARVLTTLGLPDGEWEF